MWICWSLVALPMSFICESSSGSWWPLVQPLLAVTTDHALVVQTPIHSFWIHLVECTTFTWHHKHGCSRWAICLPNSWVSNFCGCRKSRFLCSSTSMDINQFGSPSSVLHCYGFDLLSLALRYLSGLSMEHGWLVDGYDSRAQWSRVKTKKIHLYHGHLTRISNWAILSFKMTNCETTSCSMSFYCFGQRIQDKKARLILFLGFFGSTLQDFVGTIPKGNHVVTLLSWWSEIVLAVEVHPMKNKNSTKFDDWPLELGPHFICTKAQKLLTFICSYQCCFAFILPNLEGCEGKPIWI